MKKNILLAAGVFTVLICAQSVQAEMFSFSKSMGGTIADVRPDAISLTPSSPRSGSAPVDMEINDSTKLKNIQTVNDLKKGDSIQVRYKEQDGRKIAVQVEKNGEANPSAMNADTAGSSAMGTAATPTGAGNDSNTMGSQNTAEDQLYKTNQGTNVAPANRQTPGIDQSGAESSSQYNPGSGQQDQVNTDSSSPTASSNPSMNPDAQTGTTTTESQSTDPTAIQPRDSQQR